jgi:hypothetical protein
MGTFHRSALSGPNSWGGFAVSDFPLPLGPRQCPHWAAAVWAEVFCWENDGAVSLAVSWARLSVAKASELTAKAVRKKGQEGYFDIF